MVKDAYDPKKLRMIRATPTLNREEAHDFVANMIKVEKRKDPNKTERLFIEAICSNY